MGEGDRAAAEATAGLRVLESMLHEVDDHVARCVAAVEAAQVERRDPGIQRATVDESLSCDAFRESAWVDANRPEWPPALRTKLAAYAAAEPRVDFVMPPKGSPPSKGELVF